MSNDLRKTDAPQQEPSPLWARLVLVAVLLYAAALVVVVVADILDRLP